VRTYPIICKNVRYNSTRINKKTAFLGPLVILWPSCNLCALHDQMLNDGVYEGCLLFSYAIMSARKWSGAYTTPEQQLYTGHSCIRKNRPDLTSSNHLSIISSFNNGNVLVHPYKPMCILKTGWGVKQWEALVIDFMLPCLFLNKIWLSRICIWMLPIWILFRHPPYLFLCLP
jgi:hypothetical protein